MVARYCTLHSTGNPNSSARGEVKNLARLDNKRQASFHIAVDDKEAVEAIPLNEVAWHAGDGYNGTGNRKSIGIEICESGNRQKTLDNVVKVTVAMMKLHKIPIEDLRRHYDWSGKNCPRILSANDWKEWKLLKERIRKGLLEGR